MKQIGKLIFWLCNLGALGLLVLASQMFSIHRGYPDDATTFFLMCLGAAVVVFLFGLFVKNLAH